MDGRCISQTELAQRWQLSESTLERWRSEGIGPVFLKLRGQVRYRDTNILAYENQALHASTRYRAAIPLRPSTLFTNLQLPSLVCRDQQSCPSLRSGPQLPSGLHVAFPAQYRHVARFAAHHRQGVKFMQTQATHAEPTTMFNETELASR